MIQAHIHWPASKSIGSSSKYLAGSFLLEGMAYFDQGTTPLGRDFKGRWKILDKRLFFYILHGDDRGRLDIWKWNMLADLCRAGICSAWWILYDFIPSSILCYLCTRFHENGHGFHGKLQQSYTGSIPQVVTQLYIAVVAHRLLQLIAPFQWKNPHFKIPTTIVTHWLSLWLSNYSQFSMYWDSDILRIQWSITFFQIFPSYI